LSDFVRQSKRKAPRDCIAPYFKSKSRRKKNFFPPGGLFPLPHGI